MSGVFYVILLSSRARGGLYCYLWGWSCWCRCGPPGHAWTQWWEAWFRCCPLALCDHSSACRAEEFFSEEALMPPGKWGTRGGGGCPTLLCLQEETRQAHDLKSLKGLHWFLLLVQTSHRKTIFMFTLSHPVIIMPHCYITIIHPILWQSIKLGRNSFSLGRNQWTD